MPIIADLRHAVRLLVRSPIFAITSVASLALGIGAASAIFSLSNALLFEPTVGVRDADSLVDIGRANQGSGFDNMSHPMFRYLAENSRTVDIAAVDFAGGPLSLGIDGSSQRVIGTLVSARYFDVLGTRPAIGRFFRLDEDTIPGERPVAVLSHAMWVERFGGDPGILDRSVRLNGREFAVVGVAEPGFQGSSMVGTDLWLPMAMVQIARGLADTSLLTEPRSVWHVAVGRLRPAVTVEQADAELNTLIESYKKSEPRANQRHTVRVVSLGRIPGPVRTPFAAFIGFLFALTGALLAIACSNVAGMLLARAASRRREMATRLAIGAGRSRLLTQLLTETMVLFAAAAAASVPLTLWLVSLLKSSLPALPFAINLNIAVNWRVVGFSLLISLATGLIFGIAPARHALSSQLAPMLHGAHATGDRRRMRLRNVLVAAQVALSLMLVITALLFLRSLQQAAQTDPGFTTAHIQIASVDMSLAGYRGESAVSLAGRFTERLRATSGVESVAHARMIPLQGSGFGLGGVRVPGFADGGGEGRIDADWDIVSPEYFKTLGIELIEGRAFRESDRQGTPWVAIVNEAFVRRVWPGQSAIGRSFLQQISETEERPVEIVGVARNTKNRYISSPFAPFIYVPMAQQPSSHLELYVRHQPGRQMAAEIRSAIAQVEPNVPVIMLQTFEDAAAIGLLPQKLAAWVAGTVGSVGVFLAALGLYGLMAFVVNQRTREIAIRIALGASHGRVRTMVLKQAAALAGVGGAIGLILAGAAGTLAQSLLIGVPPTDPLTFGGTAALFAVVLAVAAWNPARRAASTDPAAALRAE